MTTPTTHVLFIGGRSGVGKSSAAYAASQQLAEADFAHALIEGDLLDFAHPAPEGVDLTAANLAALWGNYRALGHTRLLYTNTMSVLELDRLAAALGGPVAVTAVLLEASDATAAARLGRRETGDSLTRHLDRSRRAAALLAQRVPAGVHRLTTDGLTPSEVAERLVAWSGWAAG